MALASYANIKTAVADWLADDTLTSYITDFVTLAEARIYRELKVRQMETALSSAISSGVIAVPSGYLQMKWAYVDGSPAKPLQMVSLEQLYNKFPTRSADGKPYYIAREGSNFIFGPYPDSAYTIKGTYYKKLDVLSDSNTSNWLITDAPDLLLFASLVEAKAFIMDDPRIAIWEARYQNAKDRIESQDRDEEFSASAISPVAL
jgi:hypothetical protein